MNQAPGIVYRDRELEFTERDFQQIRTLIAERAGIVLAEHKRDMVYSRLGRCVRSRGLARFSDYLSALSQKNAKEDWQEFVNALTTNLTAFFREPHHFQLLATHFRERQQNSGEPIRIWSAGASTGEEPYSIAIALREVLGDCPLAPKILATDIDSEALKRARTGIYRLEQVRRQVDEQRVHRFFLKGSGARAGFARVRPEIAQQVTFRQLNFVGAQWPIQQRFDAIFCRNVMIYFDRETQVRLLDRFASLLNKGGLLFVGHSENFSHLTHRFRLRGQTVYTLT
ncbi:MULTISPECIES: CheR family methyltransferase [Microbulbifer]|uniref:Chemotaxis protein methyltransferase n=1 Tax=Microbulbifer celer TaxID=435905 RepID=A0ABW3U560_9GAMM|nr:MULTISPECIES: CheR family methyltransferase [Microbulbifer]UFN57808.1 chemotaxis protein-glutamate O-methyltransferase [Microbulbifer celer]